MSSELTVLMATAATIGLVHTVAGPDHYVPFIMIGRARKLSPGRLLVLTVLCGLGHVLSSVVLGAIGISVGLAIGAIESIEGIRGEVASYLMIGFGVAYAAWGLRLALRGRSHAHSHVHADGCEHEHAHDHGVGHGHLRKEGRKITMWTLFIVFVLGPCEPLIPMLMYPAARSDVLGVVLITSVFGLVTICTMSIMVLLLHRGVALVRLGSLERYVHVIAGVMIAASGLAVMAFGI
jgi:sulfite exporter TauE/SafE